jgi:hypothetical protein
MIKKLTYLGVPYSHPDPEVRQKRFEIVNKVSADLMNAGHIVFSPISHTHPIALAGGLPSDFAYWKNFDIAYLEVSRLLIVLMLPGWKESKGVTGEIEIANELGVEIQYLSYDDQT